MGSPENAAILVADDEPMLLRLVQRILSVHGWTVVTAANGDEAHQQLVAAEATDAPVQAVILDVAMPPDGGVATLERLLALRPDLGVVLTSGAAPSSDLRARLGAHGGIFLQKPFGPEMLVHALKNALGERVPRGPA